MMEKGTTTAEQVAFTTENDVVSSHLSAILPTGYLDEDGCLHKSVDVRPYTGEEEDILASPKMPMYRRLGKLLENCVTKIGEYDDPKKIKSIVRSLVVSDRLFLIVQLRIATNGLVYSMDMKCPEEECGRKAMQHIDLSEVSWGGITDPLRRQFTLKLPGTGKIVSWNVMDGAREERIHQYSLERDLLSVGIFSRINDIDGKKVTMEMVKAMSAPQRRALREEFNKKEGTIDNEIEFECPSCGHIWKASVDYAQPSFFFPSDA